MNKTIVSRIVAVAAVLVAIVAVTESGLTLAQTEQAEKPGAQAYSPSRLDWLATNLSAYYRKSMAADGYSIDYLPVGEEDAILILVRAYPQADAQAMQKDILAAHKLVTITAHSYGWDGWVKVKDKMEKQQFPQR